MGEHHLVMLQVPEFYRGEEMRRIQRNEILLFVIITS